MPAEGPGARRALLDAIYAMHAGDGRIRIDEQLAQNLERAWGEYDASVLAAAEGRAVDEMTERERGDRLESMIERLAERNVEASLEISGRVLDAVRNDGRLQTVEAFREWARRKGGSTRVVMDRAIEEVGSMPPAVPAPASGEEGE